MATRIVRKAYSAILTNQNVLEVVGCQLKSAYVQIFFASVQTRNESPIIGLQQNPQQDEESSARPAVSAASPVSPV